MKTLYFDWAATTPTSRKVMRAMKPYFSKYFGNPSSTHREGIRSRMAVEKARETIADCLGCFPDEIFFTSGASEGNSLVANNFSLVYNEGTVHDSISMACKNNNFQKQALCYTLMNSETGLEESLSAIASNSKHFFVHVDLTQYLAHYPIDLKEMNITTATFSAHKFGGPKGVGCLYIARDAQKYITPLIYGHQEESLRGGTLNVPGIVGMAVALKDTMKHFNRRNKKVKNFSYYIASKIKSKGQWFMAMNGIITFAFKKLDSQTAVRILSNYGVCVSSGSACNSGSDEPSKAYLALMGEEIADKVIRISVSYKNTKRDVKKLCKIMCKVIELYD